MRHATCRKVASILGRVRSGLFALPALRAFSDELVAFVNLHTKFGWDTPLQLPPSIRTQVPELRELLLSWPGRKFVTGATATKIFSDASDAGRGGLNPLSGQYVQDFWRTERGLHINMKELSAAIATVKSLATPHDHVHLLVDNPPPAPTSETVGGATNITTR